MINIEGYTETTYKKLQVGLNKTFAASGKSLINVANDLEIKSQMSIKNALNMDEQMVSDVLLSRVMHYLAFPALILWTSGGKKFYLPKKQ
jgi:hypothetical protein